MAKTKLLSNVLISSTHTPSPDDGPEIYEAIAAANGIAFLPKIPETASRHSHLLSKNQATSLQCVAVGRTDDKMTFAVSNPNDFSVADLLSHVMRRSADSLSFVVCHPTEIRRALALFYP